MNENDREDAVVRQIGIQAFIDATKCMLTNIKRVLKKSLALSLKAMRRIPEFALFEYRVYCDIEKQLSQAGLHTISSFFPRFVLDKHSIRESLLINSDYRVIDLDNMTDDDCKYIEKNGLSIVNITANKFCLPSESVDEAVLHQELNEYDRTFQLEAIKSRCINAICPRSGVTLHSNRSLLAEPGHTIFYRFIEHDHVFYLAVGRDGLGYIKLYMYLPELHTIILLGDRDWAWLGRWEVDQFRAFLISNYKNIYDYLNNQTIPNMCVLVDHAHFAHHMWNTLTGLSKVATKQYNGIIDSIIVTQEPMGPIDQIFPEFETKKFQRLSSSEIINFVLAKNLFLMRPGGTILTNGVVDRIHRVAVENSPSHYIKDAQDFRSKHWPILWATIRTGNRSWLSQAEGIARIANKFKKLYPDFALIVDGYAIPYGQQHISQQLADILTDEEREIQKIKDLLDQSIEVRFLVGKPIFQSVIYSRFIDFYLAHHGSLQNKIAWLSNKRGLVHSNKTALSGNYSDFTGIKSGVFPVYLDPEIVTDLPIATTERNLRWNFAHANYDFDYHYAFDELLKVIETAEYRRF
jgi:hypothetical protein